MPSDEKQLTRYYWDHECMREASDGDYVDAEDALARIAELESEVGRLRGIVKTAKIVLREMEPFAYGISEFLPDEWFVKRRVYPKWIALRDKVLEAPDAE